MPNIIGSFNGEYEFLSNFYPSPISFDGILYPTNEHAFQAYKSLSREERLDIANSATPGIAKRKGRKIILRRDWEQIKDNVMEFCLRKKFTEHLDLQKKLLETGDAILIEGNTWGDTYWGMCAGVGENKLGQLLMKIREEIITNGGNNEPTE